MLSDTSWLVRMRMAELIGVAGIKGGRGALTSLADDPDESVRDMARAFAATR